MGEAFMAATILIVDDSPSIINFLSLGLRQAGFEVYSALEGREGLDKLAQHSIDAVITDVNMPGMDGLSFISQLRKDPKLPHMPIIILSTEKSPEDSRLGLAAGADVFLNKPIAIATLVDEVKKLLAESS